MNATLRINTPLLVVGRLLGTFSVFLGGVVLPVSVVALGAGSRLFQAQGFAPTLLCEVGLTLALTGALFAMAAQAGAPRRCWVGVLLNGLALVLCWVAEGALPLL